MHSSRFTAALIAVLALGACAVAKGSAMDPRQQENTLQAITGVSRMRNPNCANYQVTAVRTLTPAEAAAADVQEPGKVSEGWMVSRCGSTAEYYVTFGPNHLYEGAKIIIPKP